MRNSRPPDQTQPIVVWSGTAARAYLKSDRRTPACVAPASYSRGTRRCREGLPLGPKPPSRSRELFASLARMSFTVLHAGDAFWRPSNQMGVLNTDLAKQLSADLLGARLWRLMPGQASTHHRHLTQHELYVVLEGTGRVRVEQEVLTLAPLSALLVEPECLRQIFNDTSTDALWLVVGTPAEAANTLEMTAEQLATLYPDGPKALPPELSDG